MITNRELDLDDYLAILRRRWKAVVVVAAIASATGLIASFGFSLKYTSSALVLVERQTVPAGYVKPIVTASVSDQITLLEQQVLSRGQLLQMAERLNLTQKGKSIDDVVDEIQRNVSITPADPSTSFGSPAISSSYPRRIGDFPGFYVNFTSNDPHEAQQICGELTSLLLAQNLKSREQVALNTTDFLARQLVDAKSNLDEQDRKLAEFKGHYLGQLPSDVDQNLKILTGLDSQLDANTQTLIRAQQDKSYAESLLTQQLAIWKNSQTSLTAETIEQRLAALQTQLVALEARYTEHHPEVVKMKADIAALEAKQKEMSATRAQSAETENWEGKAEPPQISQLRRQIHQNELTVARATDEEQRLRRLMDTYQARLTLSPGVEEQYKQLTRDYDTARRIYDTLLTDKSQSEIQTDLEHRQQGEQMHLLDPPTLPTSPSFPVRWQFAAGGFAAGFGLSAMVALWLELRDKKIRGESDVLAALGLPTLSSVPCVVPLSAGSSRGFLGRYKVLWS